MKITTEIVSKLNPCKDRFNNFTTKYPNYNNNLEDFIVLENITYNDKVWVVTRLFTKEQNIKWSILCASKVLSIFENEYPNDKRPRLALEATEAYLNNPSEENRIAARAAASAAYAAAYAASNAAYAASNPAYAASAAYAAAYAAGEAAAYSARAGDAAAYSAYSARAGDAAAAAHAAAHAGAAAHAANAAAADAESKNTEEMINLILMLECV